MEQNLLQTGSNKYATSLLLSLPRELRFLIYLFVMKDIDLQIGPVAYILDLPIQHVCKLMDCEATEAVISYCNFKFEDDVAYLRCIVSKGPITELVARSQNLVISKHDCESSAAVRACFLQRPEFVQGLFKHLDPSTRINTLADVLWVSCHMAYVDVASATVRKLSELKADATCYTRGFCLAVRHGNLGLMQELRDAGVDINGQPIYPLGGVFSKWNRKVCDCAHFRNNNKDHHHCFLGMSALSVACSYQCDESVVEFLVKYGATMDSASGVPPCHAAARYGQIPTLEWLMSGGADITKRYDGKSLLHSACDGGDASTVAFLLDHGSNVHDLTEDGWTPLAIACRRDLSASSRPTGQLKVVKTLMKNGADANTEGPPGFTPLLLAIRYSRNKDLALFLVRSGAADVHLHDPIGTCAYGPIVTDSTKEIIVSLIKDLSLASRSKIVVRSNDKKFRRRLEEFGIKTEESNHVDLTPGSPLPDLPSRCRNYYAPAPDDEVYALEYRIPKKPP